MDKQFIKDLVTATSGLDICKDGAKMVKGSKSLEELLEHYKRHVTWNHKRNYPPREIWETYVYGYCNDWLSCGVADVEFTEQPVACFLCDAAGTVKYAGGTTHGHVFAKHDAGISVEATGNALVTVFAYDNATVRVNAEDAAKVIVYLHDNARVIDTPENERITINTVQ